MSQSLVDQIADAMLYEGYMLYPYRPSVKNKQRWTFGGIYPKAYHDANGGFDAWTLKCQCLVESEMPPSLDARVRFLHLTNRSVGKLHLPLHAWLSPDEDEPGYPDHPDYKQVDRLEIGGQRYQPWQEAVSREVCLSQPPTGLPKAPQHNGEPSQNIAQPPTHARTQFAFPASRHLEPLWDNGQILGLLIREQQPIRGTLELSTEFLEPGLYRVTAEVRNDTHLDQAQTATRDQALLSSLVSTHFVLELNSDQNRQANQPGYTSRAIPENTANGETEKHQAFVSLIDPPVAHQDHARACDNRGCWPVLVGESGAPAEHGEDPEKRDPQRASTMLGSPIILYDFPQIASESPGDLFDGTEIDEILSLRIMTLTDEEKREAAATDDHAKALLERTESLARDQLMNLHGRMKPVDAENSKSESRNAKQNRDPEIENATNVESVHVGHAELSVGDRVRINPRGNADAFDVVLKGLTATIEKVETDFENRKHLAVTIDDDPGADFGRDGKPGHRFFFDPEDVQPMPAETEI